MSIDGHPPHAGHPQPEPLYRTLYRYLWPFACFRDVTRGQRMERQQNYRHNRAMRIHLPGFAFKWALLTALCFGVGIGLAGMPVVLAACLFVTGSWTFVVSLLMLTAWCWLTHFPELY